MKNTVKTSNEVTCDDQITKVERTLVVDWIPRIVNLSKKKPTHNDCTYGGPRYIRAFLLRVLYLTLNLVGQKFWNQAIKHSYNPEMESSIIFYSWVEPYITESNS
jgi:hypothetical protein